MEAERGSLGGWRASAAHAIKFARLAAAFVVETSIDSEEVLPFADAFESGTTDGWTETVQ